MNPSSLNYRKGGYSTLWKSMILFPFYKQYDSMQCGIACMAMICKYYGKGYSYDTLFRQSTATTEGMSLLGLKKNRRGSWDENSLWKSKYVTNNRSQFSMHPPLEPKPLCRTL